MPKRAIKGLVRTALPIRARQALVIWANGRRWLPARRMLCGVLLADFYERDPKAFHKFLWANHLDVYAQWYDSDELFDVSKMEASRRELFADLASLIADMGLTPGDFRSVLEVGCSVGHLLYFLETGLLSEARRFVGIDIDGAAIQRGRRFLQAVGSKVELIEADMEEVGKVLSEERFDLVFAAGVLSYLNEADALAVVREMLGRTNRLLMLVGLAHPVRNNNELERSELTGNNDGQWIHNFEDLARRAGGRVLRSRWEGAKLYNEQTICFVFVVPGER